MSTYLLQFAGSRGPRGRDGDPGEIGPQGLGIVHGDGPPSGIDGRDGEYYIDDLNKIFYGPKIDGAWGTGFPFPQDVTPELQALLDAAENARDAAQTAQGLAETAEAAAANDANTAGTSAGAAANSATAAATSETNAAASDASAAQHDADADASAVRAEIAAAVAQALGIVYTTEAAGNAASTDGHSFVVVPVATPTILSVYTRVSAGVSTLLFTVNITAFNVLALVAAVMDVVGNDSSVEIHGTIFDPVATEAANGYLWARRDASYRFLMGILASNGAIQLGQHLFESVAYNRYLLKDLFPRIDAGGNILQSHDWKTGQFKTVLHPSTLHLSDLAADLDPAIAIAAGARGTVSKVRRPGQRLMSYYSDAPGSTQRILTRSDVDRLRLHLLDTASVLGLDCGYGQSWAGLGGNVDAEYDSSIAKYIKNPDTESEMAFSVMKTNVNSGATEIVGPDVGINLPALMNDLVGWQLTDRSDIHTSRAIALARWRRWRRSGLKPQINVSAAYPASGWTAGGPDGLGLGLDGQVWPKMLAVVEAAEAAALRYGKTTERQSFYWIQAGGDTSMEASLADLQGLADAVDDEGFQHLYIGIRGNVSNKTTTTIGPKAQVSFCQTNANGHTWADFPWYMAELKSGDPDDPFTDESEAAGSIHFSGHWQVLYGEYSAYVKHMVEDLGYDSTHETPWHPLQLEEADDDAIIIDGQHVTIRFKRPPGPDWRVAELALSDLIEPAQYDGFRVKRGATFLNIGARTYSSDADYLYAEFDVVQTLAGGGTTEISYCWYGPGAVGHSGVWGNVLLPGPDTVISKIQPRFSLPLLPFGREFTL